MIDLIGILIDDKDVYLTKDEEKDLLERLPNLDDKTKEILEF